MNKKEENNKDVITTANIFNIFKRNKWWFIGTFLVVLFAGLIVLVAGTIITFLKDPIYESTSRIKISDNFFDDYLYKYYTEDAIKLGIFPTFITNDVLDTSAADNLYLNLQSEEVLDEVVKKLDFEINKDELKNSISFINDSINTIEIKVLNKNPQKAFIIINVLIEIYKQKKDLEFNQAYVNIYNNIIKQINKINDELKKLAEITDTNVIKNNKKIYEELKKSNYSGSFSGINYISPDIQSQLNFKYQIYNKLEEIKLALEQNKDFSINRIIIIREPNVASEPNNINYPNYMRYIFITLVTAIFMAVVVCLIANYAKNSKN